MPGHIRIPEVAEIKGEKDNVDDVDDDEETLKAKRDKYAKA